MFVVPFLKRKSYYSLLFSASEYWQEGELLYKLFYLITNILLHRGKVDDDTWRFLLTGGVALDNPHPNPYPQWLTDKAWSEIVRASNLKDLKGLMNG